MTVTLKDVEDRALWAIELGAGDATPSPAHSRVSGNPALEKHWVPAFAGTSGWRYYAATCSFALLAAGGFTAAIAVVRFLVE